MINESIGDHLCERDSEAYMFRIQGSDKTYSITAQKGLAAHNLLPHIRDAVLSDIELRDIFISSRFIEIYDTLTYPYKWRRFYK